MIHDVTITVRAGLPTWSGDPPVELAEWVGFAAAGGRAGDAYRVSRMSLGTHTGTHVDAPAHAFPDGPGVDRLPLDALVGPAWVVDVPSHRIVGAADLEASPAPQGTARLLIRTGNSRRGLWRSGALPERFVALSVDAARWLLDRGVRLVGVDGPSVEPAEAGVGPVHRALLAAGVVIVEGLDLAAVAPGAYRLICAPLRLAGADGSPARVLLEEDAPPAR